MGKCLFDKVWDQHVVAELGDGAVLLHLDRVMVHDLSGYRALKILEERGERVVHPELALGAPDHTALSAPGAQTAGEPYGRVGPEFMELCKRHGIRAEGVDSPDFGILHVIGPEMGLTLPGATLVCGDSHTCTHGGLGALAYGIGSSELVHVLSTQTIIQKKPNRMRILFSGALAEGVTPKDMILYVIGQEGTAAGTGYAVEYAGDAIEKMGVEGRMTICNLSIEMGAKIGMVAPDDITIDFLKGRAHAPKGADWDAAVAHWRTLKSDADALFDREIEIDVSEIKPQVTWGTSPEHVVAIDGVVPDPDDAPDADAREARLAALDYIGLRPGQAMEGVPVDWVFIGSCTNSRITDLRAAAEIVKGRKVAGSLTAWAVPGSAAVKAEAEAEGLDKVFTEAGFEWRAASCSLCVGANGETLAPGQRSISTSNRNFVGRQGPGARTHLASPVMAAAAAVTGAITDVRKLME